MEKLSSTVAEWLFSFPVALPQVGQKWRWMEAVVQLHPVEMVVDEMQMPPETAKVPPPEVKELVLTNYLERLSFPVKERVAAAEMESPEVLSMWAVALLKTMQAELK